MSRLRRLFLYDRYIFVTVNLLESRHQLQESDYARLALSLARVRRKHGFLLAAWVFLPDHWHAIICPPYPLTISRVFQAVKVSSMIAINHQRGEAGELWQGRFFDRALRTVKEYAETVEYIHMNPVRGGLVKRAEDWKWSSVHEYGGMSAEEQERRCGLRIDRVPAAEAGGAITMLRYEDWDVANRALRPDLRMKELELLYRRKAISRDALRQRCASLQVQILEDLLHDEKISQRAFEYLKAHPKSRTNIRALSRKHRGGPQVLRVLTLKSAAKTHNLQSLRPHAHEIPGGLPGLGRNR